MGVFKVQSFNSIGNFHHEQQFAPAFQEPSTMMRERFTSFEMSNGSGAQTNNANTQFVEQTVVQHSQQG